ncbi:MAG: STAS domain-containing protein [Planctomycetota bacterium]
MASSSEVTTEVVHDGEVCILTVSGDLCDDSAITVRDCLMEAPSDETKHIALQCSKIGYVSSAGIGMLVAVLKRMHQQGVSMVLCDLHDELQELFALTRLDQVFTIAPSLQDWRDTQK